MRSFFISFEVALLVTCGPFGPHSKNPLTINEVGQLVSKFHLCETAGIRLINYQSNFGLCDVIFNYFDFDIPGLHGMINYWFGFGISHPIFY